MTTLKAHERRITFLEETVTSHGETLYKLRRESVENRLGLRMIIEHLGLPLINEVQIDEVLDAE